MINRIQVCNNNQLPTLDVTGATSLIQLDCHNNQLTSLDITGTTSLILLHCYNNQLTTLDVSTNTAIYQLLLYNNLLTSLDVSGHPSLGYLECSSNLLTSLDVTGGSGLWWLQCSFNILTSIDVSTNPLLQILQCYENQLTSLNIKNGNNINIYTFACQGNQNLSCIEVDNVQWSINNWTAGAPQTAFFSEDCSALGISDNNLNTAVLAYPNPTQGMIYLSEPGNIVLNDLAGQLLLKEKNTNKLDISSLHAGMYFLCVGDNLKQTFKVIKE